MISMKENISQIIVLKKRSGARNSVRITDKKVVRIREEIRQYYDKNGYLSWSEKKGKYVILGTNTPANGLVECPECKIGSFWSYVLGRQENASWDALTITMDVEPLLR